MKPDTDWIELARSCASFRKFYRWRNGQMETRIEPIKGQYDPA